MRFVFLSTMLGSPWGGSEELWSQAALRLRRGGNHVAASAIWWPQPSPKVTALARAGIDIRFRNNPMSQWQRLRARLGRQTDALSEDITWVRQQKPDLVVVPQGGNADGWAWLRFCRDHDLPFV